MVICLLDGFVPFAVIRKPAKSTSFLAEFKLFGVKDNTIAEANVSESLLYIKNFPQCPHPIRRYRQHIGFCEVRALLGHKKALCMHPRTLLCGPRQYL